MNVINEFGMIGLYYLCVNIIAFILAGSWMGMQAFRHKTKHLSFRVLVPVFVLVHVGIIVFMIR